MKDKQSDDQWKLQTIQKVLYRASLGAVCVYVIVGVFGYMLFSESAQKTYD